jgi:hypothetical protein
MTPSIVIAALSDEYFNKVLNACPRKARESLFVSFGVPKSKKKASALLPGRDPERGNKLRAVMAEVDADEETFQQMGEELIRVYLMGRRDLLGAALDHMGIAHNDGLTDDELEAFGKLNPAAAKALRDELLKNHDPADVGLYLSFMDVASI